MVISGYVESVDTLPSTDPKQKPLNCIMLDGLPVLAQAETPIPFAVGDKVDIAVRITGKRGIFDGVSKVLRTFWFSAPVLVNGRSPASVPAPAPSFP